MQSRYLQRLEAQIESLAIEKFNADLDLSVCHNPEFAVHAREEALRRIQIAESSARIDLQRSITDKSPFAGYILDPKGKLPSLTRPNHILSQKLDEIRATRADNPILINCECIEPAAALVFRIMEEQYSIPLCIFTRDISGRQQVMRISSDPSTEILVTANAAFNFSSTGEAKAYQQVMELHWETQELLVWKRENSRKGTVFVYETSSATEQFKELHTYFDARNKKVHWCSSIGAIVEEVDARRIYPGDYVIAWEPLSTGLITRSRGRLRRLPRKRYRHLISLYAREDWTIGRANELETFLDVFRYVWVACILDRSLAKEQLLSDKLLLSQLATGAGLGNQFA